MSFSFGPSAGAPAPTSSFSFGSTATSQPSAFSFGPTTSTVAAPTFGAATSAAPAFGAATSAAAPAFGGFGTAAAAPKPAPLSFGGFGSTATSSSTPAFGSFGQPAAAGAGTLGGGGSAFGGTGFGAGLGAGTGLFSGTQSKPFGTTGTSFGLGQPQPTQAVAQAPAGNPVEQLYSAVLQVSVFGDERDAILARWNMLQASWGSGKAVYSQTMPPIDLNAQNPLNRFKTIGYSALPSSKADEGLICAIIKKKTSELEPQRAQIAAGISGVLGNRPNVKVVIENIRQCYAGAGSEVVFYVQETNAQNGQTKRIVSSEIHAFLSQPANTQKMQQMGFESAVPKVAFSEKEVKAYLETPPQGVDPRLWKQAQLDNPDPSKMIPVPLIGFKALQARIACQEQQAKTHQGRLDAIAGEVADVQKRHEDTLAKMREAKRKHLALAHRVLHVVVKQEVTRKTGFTIQPEEERLGAQLEALQAEMSAPTQFKGKLNELLSQVRLQSQASASQHAVAAVGEKQPPLDEFLIQDVKEVLRQQQVGLQALIGVIKEDMEDLGVISDAVYSK